MGMWNCRKGLIDMNYEATSKFEEVKQFLIKRKLHMLCLIETDLHGTMSRHRRTVTLTKNDIYSVLGISGYNIYLPSTWKRHGQARILVYAKEELNINEKQLEASLTDLPILSFEISLGKEKKTIVNFFYREFTSGVTGLKTSQEQLERLNRMIKHWKILMDSNKDVVCLGDANLCAMKWNDSNYQFKEHAETVQTFLLETETSQLVKQFTRSEFARGGVVSRSCIDHCYSNAPGKVSHPEIVAVGSSDHLGIVITKYTRAPKIKPKVIMKRSYKNFKVEDFLKDILNSNINENVKAVQNVEEAALEFEKTFKEILDVHAPIKIFQTRSNYSPFLSEKTKKLIEMRNSWKEMAVKFGYKSAEKIAKDIGKEIKRATTEDKATYFNKDFGECCDRSNAWKTAKTIIGMNNNSSPTSIKVADVHGSVQHVRNPQQLAQLFNKFFKNKVDVLRQKTDRTPVVSPAARLKNWLSKRSNPLPPFKIKEINLNQFRKIMKKIKKKRTHGTDWIDKGSLKIAGPLVEEALMHLINLSIREGRFSSRWKPQLIFPHHKKKERDLLENYRPVSHLVQVGIMVEYAVYSQIVEHFVKYDLFHPNHHGSIANHSTTTALIQLHDTWLEAADKQELSGVCLLDQSAAYDLLCHQTLREKLELYNFDKTSIDWLMSYLGGRTQLVQIESKVSEPIEGGDHAVPQGSVLGGLLHVINSNDLPACHQEGDSVVYVDDNSDTVSAKDPVVLRNSIENEAGNSAQWLKDNRLCVAGDKSKLLVIGTRKLRSSKLTEKTTIMVDNKEIVETDSEKLLGVVINNELTWKNHLYGDADNEGLIQQLSSRIGVMKKMARVMEAKNLQFFASGLFYSKLSYCLPVFGHVLGMEKYNDRNSRYQSYTTKDNRKLQVLQNNLNRVLLKAKYDTNTEVLLKETKSLSIQQMIAYQTAVLAFKIINTGKPSYIASRMKRIETGLALRDQKGKIRLEKRRLAITKEGFIHRASIILNNIDEDLRNEDNLKKFKLGMREWVLKNISTKPRPKFDRAENRVVPRNIALVNNTDQRDIRQFLINQTEPFGAPFPPRSSQPTPTDRPPPAPNRDQVTVQGILRYFSQERNQQTKNYSEQEDMN